jgi:hypothetical protein
MMDVDPRSTASRALRASVGLTALAAALLACGAAVEVTGNLLDSSANGSSGSSHPATTVQPTHARSRVSEAPSPNRRPPPTSPAYLPRPTTTATATCSSLNGQ